MSTAPPPSPAMPRIGITAWRRALPTPLGERTDLFTLGTEYVHAVQAAGGLALLVPHGADPGAVLDALDALVLSGGGDVDPYSYQAANAGATKDIDAAADAWEIALVREARRRAMPVLGICRGMQIMAVASGGRLDQEIAGRGGHPDMRHMDAAAVLAARHAVALDADSRLAAVYGTSTRQVNTIHHQAVTDAGDLRVCARDVAGLIEGVEATSGWPAFGVQWHPEKMTDDDARAEHALFVHLVEDARRFARATPTHGA